VSGPPGEVPDKVRISAAPAPAAGQGFVREATGLVKALSAWDSLSMNFVFMAVGCLFLCYSVVGIYVGANVPVGILITTVASFLIAGLYALLSIAMPRTGGDYVWVSRALSPPVGFMVNFIFTFTMLAFTGIVSTLIYPAFIVDPLRGAAIITGDATYSSLADSLSSPPWSTLFPFVFAATPLLMLLGLKRYVKILWAGFVAGVVALAIVIGQLLLVSRADFASSFSAASGMKYLDVISSAEQAGWAPGFTFGGTILGSVYAFLNTLGYTGNAYFLGEIKGAFRLRTHIIAMFGSLLLFGFFGALLYAAVYLSMGAEFFQSVTYLFGTGHAVLPFFQPSASTLLAYATKSLGLYLLANFAIAFSYLTSVMTWPFVVVRNLFAWSFDRLLPAWVASVDSRGNPWAASLLGVLVSEAYVALVLSYPSTAAWLAYQIFGWSLAWAVVGIAGALLPFRRKNLFEVSPAPVRRRLGRVPLITVLGAASALYSALIAYATISPVFIGTVDPFFLSLTLVLFVIGVAIYYVAYLIRKRQGIPMEAIYASLPPE
jgi:amino acid transporter